MSGRAIQVRVGFDAFAARLARRAAALARARTAATLLAARGDARRWRRPALLWPLFAKG
ncbi:hypothetical protein [Novosphingobium soli]|uniref:Uncharacterized protein n=1 Tax=Novosphingobium soli TaxID=574956 RepID=A0ABV6CWW4_9SPHN